MVAVGFSAFPPMCKELYNQRGEWLKRFGYGAESSWKVMSPKLGFSLQQLENSVNPAVNGYLFLDQGRIRKGKGRNGLCFSSAVPKIQWASNPHKPYVN